MELIDPRDADQHAADQHDDLGPEAVDEPALERHQPCLGQHEDGEGHLDRSAAPAILLVDRIDEQRPAVLQVGDHHHADDASTELKPAIRRASSVRGTAERHRPQCSPLPITGSHSLIGANTISSGSIALDSVMQTPFKPIDFLSRDIRVDRRGDGTILLQSNHQLKPYERHVPAFLAKWAREAPDRVWLAQRRGPDREWLKAHLCRGQAAGRCGDPGADRSRLRPGQAGDDPVLQLHRVRAAHHGRHAGARAAGAGVAGLLGDEPGPRQAALRLRPREARHGVRAERRDLCPRAGGAGPGRRPAGACRQGAAADAVAALERTFSDHGRPMPSRARSSRSTPRRSANSCSPRAAPACPRR